MSQKTNNHNSLAHHLKLTTDVTITHQANISISQFPTNKVNIISFTSTYWLLKVWSCRLGCQTSLYRIVLHRAVSLFGVNMVIPEAENVEVVRERVHLISVGLQILFRFQPSPACKDIFYTDPCSVYWLCHDMFGNLPRPFRFSHVKHS